jgi:hypothetical protein
MEETLENIEINANETIVDEWDNHIGDHTCF